MRIVKLTAFLLLGILLGEAHAHIRPTMWGWVWTLEPEPDFPIGIAGVKPSTQMVRCPNGDFTLPPWHVYVLWHDNLPLSNFSTVFLQERGR